jgi:hypothetical protein
MNIFKKLTIFSFLCFFALPAFGAQVSFTSEKQSFATNEEFLVSVFLDAEGETLNAFEGKIFFPIDLLEEKEIRNGDSLVNFWIEKPSLLPDGRGGKAGEIIFSGITPGGFSGTKELLFSVVFRAKKGGEGVVNMEGLRVLKNDGNGTKAEVKTSPFSFSISEEFASSSSTMAPVKDTESPEDFTPIIASDPNIFEGKYFLVFVAQDKGSGIDRYELSEDGGKSFSPAHSPFLLQNQALDTKIIIKAIDASGNEKIAELPAEHFAKWKQYFLIFGILLLSALVGFFYREKLWKKNISN